MPVLSVSTKETSSSQFPELKTKSNVSAMRASKSLTQKLEDYWTSLRITKFEVPVQHLLSKDKSVVTSSEAPKLSEALSLYLKLKGIGKDKTFVRGANRNIRYVIEFLGDYPIDAFDSKDASAFRDHLISKGLVIASVKRVFSSIRSIINLAIQEEGITCSNAFSKIYMPESLDSEKRQPIPKSAINLIQNKCREKDDEL